MLYDGDFLFKVLKRDFESLTLDEINIIFSNYSLFGLTKKSMQIMKKTLSLGENFLTSVKDQLKQSVPSSIVILNNVEKDSSVGFKYLFNSQLNKMNGLQLCFLIDKMGQFMREEKLRFFGGRNKMQDAYHKLNMLISNQFGFKCAFKVFHSSIANKFRFVNYDSLNTQVIVKFLMDSCINHFSVLTRFAAVILSDVSDVQAIDLRGYHTYFKTKSGLITRHIHEDSDYVGYLLVVQEAKNNLKKCTSKTSEVEFNLLIDDLSFLPSDDESEGD